MFDRDKYETTKVNDLLVIPDNLIQSDEKMESVMLKFEVSSVWNLPVVDSKSKYQGFVSNSCLFGAYRKWLKETSGDYSFKNLKTQMWIPKTARVLQHVTNGLSFQGKHFPIVSKVLLV